MNCFLLFELPLRNLATSSSTATLLIVRYSSNAPNKTLRVGRLRSLYGIGYTLATI